MLIFFHAYDNNEPAPIDIDSRSLEYAQMNVRQNDLDRRIQLLKVEPQELLLPPDIFVYVPDRVVDYICDLMM
jgi:23S rRNA A1618 N6-methylase RlmF